MLQGIGSVLLRYSNLHFMVKHMYTLYFSCRHVLQVDFAEGDDWEWVADKLQQLSTALGNTRVTAVPEQHLIRIM